MTNTDSFKKQLDKFRSLFGLPDEEEGYVYKKAKIDVGDCMPGCELCGGFGIVASNDGWTICPNNPRRFYGTGVDEADTELWKILPKTNNVIHIREALSGVLAAKSGLVYLYGTPGIGKSVCARAYTVEAINAGMSACYTQQSTMINRLRASYNADNGQEEYLSRLNRYKNYDWLVIDELGRDRMNDFSLKNLAEIIDARYTGALKRNKATVLISNFPPEDICPAYIVDRIRDKRNVVLNLQGKSLRGK